MATEPLAGLPPLEDPGARRAFGAGRGLDGVDLRLERGEIYALLGPNGAGKTSLVRAIYGRVRLDSGEVTMAGRDPRVSARPARGSGSCRRSWRSTPTSLRARTSRSSDDSRG